MSRIKLFAVLCAVVIGTPLFAGESTTRSEDARVAPADFAILAGAGWSGSLSYRDYSSDKEQKIPVEVQFDEPGSRKVVYRIKYPGESQYNARESLKWSRDGRKLNGKMIVSREQAPPGTTVLVTQFDGEDDNRPAEIRMIYSLNRNALSISKFVRFEGQEDFMRRNAYELAR
ncbi:MAG: hypothetical protein KJO80_01625 [Gammaproteobacteria bacterium]|nr:hypothetical protein [Gammaproteobacteria bacterium]